MTEDSLDTDRFTGNTSGSHSCGDSSGAGGSAKRRAPRKPAKTKAVSDEMLMKEAMRLWARAGKLTKKERIAALAAARGDWKDRPDWKGLNSIQIVQLIRRNVSGRIRNG